MYKYGAYELIDKSEKIYIDKYKAYKELTEHTHDFIEMEYICHGSGNEVVNGTAYQAERGDLFFLNFGDTHSYNPSGEMGIICCLIKPEFLNEDLMESENALDIFTLAYFKEFNTDIHKTFPKIKLYGDDLSEVETLMELMLKEFTKKSSGYLTALKCLTNVLLVRILRAIKSSGSLNVLHDIKKITPTVLKYMEDNYNKKISLRELAQICYYNPNYFSSIFKECFGKTPLEYIIEKRINESVKMIKETDFSIEKISHLVGYNNKMLFYKHFKAYKGITPNEFRKKSVNSIP